MAAKTPDIFPFTPDLILESLTDGFQAFDREWRYVYLNKRAEQILGRSRRELLGKVCWEEYPDAVGTPFHQKYLEAMTTGRTVIFEEFCPHEETWVEFTLHPYPGGLGAFNKDITDRKRVEKERRDAVERAERVVSDLAEERETLDTVNRIGRLLSAELDLDRLVQAATDAATELTGAQFGAFFFNKTDANGESMLLYTISGVPREAFSRFPMPRATQLFGPTFRGEGIIRVGDVTKDARYGHMAPHHGMPEGHLPVRSYLAVPVISRSGEGLGGLFFGHAEPDVFTEHAERNIQSLVAQVAIAMDNARLFGDALRATEQARSSRDQAVREIEERKKAEQALARKARLAALRADISAALAQRGSLKEVLQQCAGALLKHLDAAFAGVWILDEQRNVLILQACAPASLRGDDSEVRMPFDKERIGRIARQKQPDLRNHIRSRNKERDDKEGTAVFAGYPLLIEERVIGVVALSVREHLPIDTLEELYSVADALAQVVERKLAEQRLSESESRQRTLLKDVLGSVTEGKLRLCESADDLPDRLPAVGEPVTLSAENLRLLRKQALEACAKAGLPADRMNDLVTATSETGMNAVVHAGGGIGSVGFDASSGMVQVWVEDKGSGIDMGSLPRATLDRGYTTAGTLGHGFKMVLNTVDAVWLLTGRGGTTVVLQQGRETPGPSWLEKWMARGEILGK